VLGQLPLIRRQRPRLEQDPHPRRLLRCWWDWHYPIARIAERSDLPAEQILIRKQQRRAQLMLNRQRHCTPLCGSTSLPLPRRLHKHRQRPNLRRILLMPGLQLAGYVGRRRQVVATGTFGEVPVDLIARHTEQAGTVHRSTLPFQCLDHRFCELPRPLARRSAQLA
jgi:hypothetical protein